MKYALLFAFFALTVNRCTEVHAQAAYDPGPPPACLPFQYPNNFHSAISSDGYTVNVMWCDGVAGTYSWVIGGSSSEAATCMKSLPPFNWSLAWFSSAWKACANRPMTAGELAAANTLLKKYGPRLRVAGPGPQAIYLVKPDGTMGPRWVDHNTPMTINAGQRCDSPRLLKAGARYHRVQWLMSSDNYTIPTGGYARCDISFAPPTGWP